MSLFERLDCHCFFFLIISLINLVYQSELTSSTAAAVACGCVGGLLLGIMATFLYFNRVKGDKKKLPAIHTQLSDEEPDSNTTFSGINENRDVIPRISDPTSQRILISCLSAPTISSDTISPDGYRPVSITRLHFDEVYPISKSNA